MKVEVYQSVAGVLWWREEEGIWHLRPSVGHVSTPDDAEALLVAFKGFRGGMRAPMLVDRSNSYSPSFGALRVLWPRATAFISALAYYVPTLEAQVASMSVIQTFLSSVIDHVAVFDDEADAVRWLVSRHSS